MSNKETMSKKARSLVWFLTAMYPDSGDFYKPLEEEYSPDQADKVTLVEILNLMYANFDYYTSIDDPRESELEDIEMAEEYLIDLRATVPNVGSGLPHQIPNISDAKKPYILEAAIYMLNEAKELISHDD